MLLIFDIGGTHTRLGTSLDGKTLLKTATIPTNLDFPKALEEIKKTVMELTENQKITLVGGGVRALDYSKTKLVNHPYFPMWVGVPLKNKLEEAFDCQVYLENDAALAGLGEAVEGAGKGHQIVAYITVGTGIGGARIVNGKLDLATFGFEPGQQVLSINNDMYPYYNGLGYLESFISGTALEKRFKVKPNQLVNPAVWDDVAKYLALGLNNTIVHWSPSIVILGGGMINLIPLEALEFHLKQTLKIYPVMPEIKKNKLGDQAGLIGALIYLKQKSLTESHN
jgi:predicted NBD/HSP70 family sugar kinase